ncbi:hypothetical protein HNR00_004771 [Methylorubrum rhodinum]|uniref:Uncharacterized protein n=1 Tax=Methylorubrum rhodinum TaxID=29428 RepID=A0A840ZT66_9HYPH|nr:hypothetical protein [Methylorubrum rhodinum]MBB5760031.1 hypothetical protein [Methylorubrum rhodinum]
MLMYNVRQRLVDRLSGGLRWRISYTGDAPVVIDYPGLIGLGLQFGLEQLEIGDLILNETFPAPLRPPENEPGWVGLDQWSYRDAVVALVAAGERKRAG